MMTEVEFGPWLPEQTDYKNPGLEVALNCYPSPSGYQPIYSLDGTGATVSGDIIGARSFRRSTGTIVTCVATTSDLYVIVGGTATASSLSLSLTAGTDRVLFERFEAEVYAATKNGATWRLTDVDSDTSFASVSIPEANAMARVGDFLVVGDVNDGTDYPYRIQWSPFNNPAGTWGSDIATQADFQPLDPQQGVMKAISGGTFGIVFQENGISRMTYRGDSSIFAFDLYEKNRGCIAPQSVARVGDTAYFLSYDGFFRTDGASVQSISRGRIWSWFLNNVNQSYLNDIHAAIDWEKRCVVWYCVSPAAVGRMFDRRMYYNWETDNWSYVDESSSFGVETNRSSATTMDGLASTYPNLDTMGISLDSEVFRASGSTLGMFTGGELATATAASLAVTFQTGSFQPATGRRSFVRSVTPLLANNAEDTSVSVGYRDAMTKGFNTAPSVTIGPIGYAPLNVDGRYFRVGVTIPASRDWTDAFGFQVDHVRSGAF